MAAKRRGSRGFPRGQQVDVDRRCALHVLWHRSELQALMHRPLDGVEESQLLLELKRIATSNGLAKVFVQWR